MAASRWSALEVQVLVLVVAAVVAVTRVNCNGTIASAAVQEMIDDPGSASKSWGRVAKEATDWGKDMIVQGLRLNRSGCRVGGDAPQAPQDDGELRSNIPREATLRAYETAEEASIRAKRNCQHSMKSCEIANDVPVERAPPVTEFAAVETSKHAKLWGDKMGETIRRIKDKAKSAVNRALLMKNSVFGKLEGQEQEVKGKITKENFKEDLEVVKEMGKHQEEMAAQKAEEEKWTVSQNNARNAKETTGNNRRKKVINERKVIEDSNEL
ncbi:uncharacterized protein LOC110706723 [Chenopodium quinoa]|uniref:uncharacterized protein LOC110706723 n=1 Tax=Chenopodium quinoa TaxID=63459 RepID=UPI000B793A77|nr:uncharacterized protein LOC110706723 [Chenopodium quinoa]